MKIRILIFASSLMLLSSTAMTQEPGAAAEDSGIPIQILIDQMAEEMDREFVIHPSVRGLRAITTRDDIDYESLLGILRLNNIIAIEAGEQIHVMPDQNMRIAATRILQEDDPRVSDHEVVTRIITVPPIPDARTPEQLAAVTEVNPFAATPSSATQLVPILRPMMSQSAQLGAVAGTNQLILVDRYDNIRRITAIIEEIVEGIDN